MSFAMLYRTSWSRWFAVWFGVVGVWGMGFPCLAASDPCAGFTLPSERKACWKLQMQAADMRLNSTYRLLRKRLPATEKQELKKDSRAWIHYKHFQCGFEAEMQHKTRKDPRDTDTYFSCVYGYTVSRERYLRQAFGHEGVSKTSTDGEYRDTFGGTLTLQTKNGALHFQLQVVRGPTHHVGEIKGILQRKGDIGSFSTPDDMSPSRMCQIQASFRPLRISLKATNCSSFHGARAYFDGLYRKVK